MPFYMYQGAYTSEAWASMVQNPQNRMEAVTPAIERLGGKIHGFYYAFGEYDVVVIMEFPDSVSVSAIALAVAASGAVKSGKTTPLLTVDETLEAMRKAGDVGYRPPTG